MLGRIKIRPSDKLFSLFIRNRDQMCMRCMKKLPIEELQNSHYFGRTMKSVRYDEENCDSLDFGCHRFWEKEDRESYRQFKVKQLGQRGYDLLCLRANTPAKIDEKAIVMYYRAKLQEMGVI